MENNIFLCTITRTFRLSQMYINLPCHTGIWTVVMFWWRTMGCVWLVILACPWSWLEIVSYDRGKRTTLQLVRSVFSFIWFCRIDDPLMNMFVVFYECSVQNCWWKQYFSPHTCCLGGNHTLHGPGSARGSGEPQGLRVGFETGGYVRNRTHLLGDLHEMPWPLSRWEPGTKNCIQT